METNTRNVHCAVARRGGALFMKQKLLSLVLAAMLLLGVFAGCQNTPSEEAPGEEPSTPETAKVVWNVNCEVGSLYGLVHEDWMTDGLRYAFECEADDTMMFCIETYNLDSILSFLEENGAVPHEGNRYSYSTNKDLELVTAIITREQLEELEEISPLVGLGGPDRPEGYSETISDSLAFTLEHLPRDSYRVMVFTKRHRSSGKFSDEEKRECMDDILEKTGLKGCYTRNLYGGNEEFAKRDEEQFNDEGYELTADGESYTGAMQLVLTKEQVQTLAENTRVKSIEIIPEYTDAYYITTLEDGELTNETEVVQIYTP